MILQSVFLFDYISCSFVIVVIIRINVSILFYSILFLNRANKVEKFDEIP